MELSDQLLKIEYIESIKHRLSSVNKTIKFDNRVIEIFIDNEYNDFIYRLYSTTTSFSLLAKEYLVDVEQEKNKLWFELPAPIVSLPNDAGIYYVRYENGETLVPSDLRANDIFTRLNIDSFDDRDSFSLKGGIVSISLCRVKSVPKQVYISVIRPFKAYSDMEMVYFPKQSSGAIALQVINKLSGEPPVDLSVNTQNQINPQPIKQ